MSISAKLRNAASKFYRIPYCVPYWGWAEHRAILRCLLTGRLIKGPDRERLYQAFEKMTGVSFVFGFNSGHEAIYAALKAREIGVGDKVILPSFCCETVVQPVCQCGAAPLFCDIGEDLNPDMNHILSLIDDRVKAVIVPHLFGRPAAIDYLEKKLEASGKRKEILLIDDAAQSFGATLAGKLIGTFGNVGVVSFGPGKSMTASGGGLLLTNSREEAARIKNVGSATLPLQDKLKRLFYCILFRRWRRFTLPLLPQFSRFLRTGETYVLPAVLCNVDAAIAGCQLRRLDSLIEVRTRRGDDLDCALAPFDGKIVNLIREARSPASGLMATRSFPVKYAVRLSDGPGIEKAFEAFFARLGVELQPLYTPLHREERYAAFTTCLPNTDRLVAGLIHVPVEPSMTDGQFRGLVRCLSAFLHQACPKSLGIACSL